MEGWRSLGVTEKGKRRTVFHRREGFADLHQVVPCGACLGCQTRRVQDWSVRCAHEAQLHAVSSFVTLMYDDENVPHVGDDLDAPLTLRPDDWVQFMYRLREDQGPGIRFFQAGEYGSLGRPHHHALLFGYWPKDAKKWKKSKQSWLYTSEELSELWSHGFVSLGSVEPASAAYVAQYALKKCGRLPVGSVPEYQTMSRRPGLGAGWLERYGGDVFPTDEVILSGGGKRQPPRYYLEKLPEVTRRLIKSGRWLKSKPEETGSGRLYAKQEVLRSKIKRAVRAEVK